MNQAVYVTRDNPSDAKTVDVAPGALPDGGVRLKIESFAVTANNVTYAVAGDRFGYWNFFPAAGDDGIVPMWGHAVVEESNHDEFAVGERVYGYIPMGTHLNVMPGKVTPHGFVDLAEHRQPMSPIYNQYSRLAADPEHDPAKEPERMIFGPLFKTGFLIENFMRRESWFGAEQVILTSASSKTAMGLASVTKDRSPDIRRIGLTSAGNVAFVEKTGLYDEVVAYGDVESLAQNPSVTVDFAGNAGLLAELHNHFGENLKYSCLVGATHIEARGGALGGPAKMSGPEPILFFAPDHAVALFKDLGHEEAAKQLAASWHKFIADVGDTVQVDIREGIDAAREAFVTMMSGKVDPAQGIVIKP
ncbi:DUF2855 family protein [Pontixanthobacter aestiaquae]|uniref:DUF2855 family protein n=1 Tax=Pontixanthobacter aestiaquae TaxID=1509367 RepID=A0A844Z9V9_9SPHN|nr:DUF2855 family protein [Pontixanthobacter aestiaquae]MDN3645197.1 DUF2855 family protein [Pontixanthobacter aestiaquae]MXO83803.1 DUF2855 family protein [Pontixanthobacter aestiaquae]